jgi:hypothetical protein
VIFYLGELFMQSKNKFLIGLLLIIFGSSEIYAGRTLVVPVMRLRGDLTPVHTDIYAYRPGQNPPYSLNFIQARYRIEISNISNVRQTLNLRYRTDTEGEGLCDGGGKANSVLFSGIVMTRSIAAGASMSAFLDYDCEMTTQSRCFFKVNGNQIGNAKVYNNTRCKRANHAFTLALTIEVDEDIGALSGVIGTIINYRPNDRTKDQTETFPVPLDPKLPGTIHFTFDLGQQGAVGAIPLNGGRPF